MTDQVFWKLIALLGGSRTDHETTDFEPLIAELAKMGPEAIAAFYETLSRKAYALDTRKHYRSFSWFPGSADSFLYIRLGVVASGPENYQKVLENPRSFPSGWKTTFWNEYLLYVADQALLKATGEEFDREASVNIESFSNTKGWSK